MYSKIVAGVIIFLQAFCTGGYPRQNHSLKQPGCSATAAELTDVKSIPLPEGFKRVALPKKSFGAWLRTISLKKDNTVYLYDGTPKPNQAAQFAVLNMSVGDKNLQQCADAIIRLRAEYLFYQQDFGNIIFTDNEGGVYQFDPPYTQKRLAAYLQKVFGMCGTASLSKQLLSAKMMNMQVGDVLIRGGFPGHAVIVMDMAENDEGEKIYLLAQSYMPAQDIHILKNAQNESASPWYTLNSNKDIFTPEYHFTWDQLKTWW